MFLIHKIVFFSVFFVLHATKNCVQDALVPGAFAYKKHFGAAISPTFSRPVFYKIRSCWIRIFVASATCLYAGVCSAQQSALDPASAQAEGIALLWWSMFYGGVIIFIAVMGLLGYGLWSAHRNDDKPLSEVASRNLVIVAGVAIPLLVLMCLVGGSLLLGKTIASDAPANALNVRIVGHMWWWEIEYLNEEGRVIAATANELHVPVGRPVNILLTSADVIHSFWVPELHGKTDLVPGIVNDSWFTADRAGVFRGQCAEFCGVQHALMAFLVIADPPEKFDQWLDSQRQDALAPATPNAERGQQVFLSSGCAQCHTIRGTPANGELGPDLTHLAERETIAAASRPNTRGHLSGWISDPQSIKPGTYMPRTLLPPEALNDLVIYLESLN